MRQGGTAIVYHGGNANGTLQDRDRPVQLAIRVAAVVAWSVAKRTEEDAIIKEVDVDPIACAQKPDLSCSGRKKCFLVPPPLQVNATLISRTPDVKLGLRQSDASNEQICARVLPLAGVPRISPGPCFPLAEERPGKEPGLAIVAADNFLGIALAQSWVASSSLRLLCASFQLKLAALPSHHDRCQLHGGFLEVASNSVKFRGSLLEYPFIAALR
jgi:hypothetical protein